MPSLRTSNDETFLVINDSKKDSDLFYATRFLVGDPLIYIEHGDRRSSWSVISSTAAPKKRRM